MKLMRYMLAFLLALLLVSAAAFGVKNAAAASVPVQPPCDRLSLSVIHNSKI